MNALVTGATGGIGSAVCRALSVGGSFVWVAARRIAAAEALAAELVAGGGRAGGLALDVSDQASITAAVERTAGQPVDLLVNNAGVAISAPLIGKGEDRDLYALHMAVNFRGPQRLGEALLPGMIARGGGQIVNVASSAALVGYAYVAAYCASKHALLGYARAASLELERKRVGVHCVCPHYVDSPMTDASAARIAEKTGRSEAEARGFLAAQNPGGALVSPEEVAGAVAELAVSGGTGGVLELLGGSRRWVEEPRLFEGDPS